MLAGGTRVGLREICVADVGERYVGWLNDPVIAQFLESRFADADPGVRDGRSSNSSSPTPPC